jgi:hypothetical protein
VCTSHISGSIPVFLAPSLAYGFLPLFCLPASSRLPSSRLLLGSPIPSPFSFFLPFSGSPFFLSPSPFFSSLDVLRLLPFLLYVFASAGPFLHLF